jgi:hypothetical protein
MMRPVKSGTGKLLFKWDKDKRLIEIQKKCEIHYFKVTKEGELEAVVSPPPSTRPK